MLLQFIKSSYSILKPNGIIIGATCAINDVKDLDIGAFQNNPKFCVATPLDNQRKEGLWTHFVGSGPDPFEFNVYLYDYKTYQTLFTKCGFRKFRFLEPNEYKTGDNSTKDEKELFTQFVNHKGLFCRVFVAQK
eukprot:UN05619